MQKIRISLRTMIKVSLIVYILLLTWIIVFKFRLRIADLRYIRSINLIPFKSNGTVNEMRETFINIMLFIPFGMYLEYLFRGRRFLNITIITLISLCYEVLQYIFHIGVSDITDIIMNTLGGIIGIILVYIFLFLFIKILKCDHFQRLLEILLLIIPILIILIIFIV